MYVGDLAKDFWLGDFLANHLNGIGVHAATLYALNGLTVEGSTCFIARKTVAPGETPPSFCHAGIAAPEGLLFNYDLCAPLEVVRPVSRGVVNNEALLGTYHQNPAHV